MRFLTTSSLEYQVTAPCTLIFSVRARAQGLQQPLTESLTIEPQIISELFFTPTDFNCFDRVHLTQSGVITVNYRAEVGTAFRLLDAAPLRQTPPAQLDPQILPYLFPSRYCQSDRLGRLARQKFGAIGDAYDQVLAITDWIHRTIEYLPGATTSESSAFDMVTQRSGVCRDFSHLAIALCRALNIPARYLSAYATALQPSDFHACFEAYIGNTWLAFDPTRLASPNGLVRIGNGRDAADVAVCTCFGAATLLSQSVNCVPLDPGFQPLDRHALESTAVCLDPSAGPSSSPS
jgi:transglutaminase-like putative cysteine protease